MVSNNKLKIIEGITKGSHNRLKEIYIKKNHPDLYYEIIKYTNKIDVRFPYRIWHWVNEEPNYIRCYCGNRVSEKMNWRDGYKKYCSNKCSSNSKETKEKLKKTNLKKYGVEHYSKTKEYVEKVKRTSTEKWGVDNYSKTKDFLKKSKKTYMEKYGVDNFTKTNEYLKKSKETSLKNWGVDFPMQSEIVKLKVRETNFKKYGTDHIFKNNDYRELNFNISSHPDYISYENGQNLFKCDCDKDHIFLIETDIYYGRISNKNKLCTTCYPISKLSSIKENMLYEYIKNVYNGNIKTNYKIGRLEIDIYLPSLKLGFEFNGIYWHSDKYKDKWYHLDKTNYFKEKGIRIIHIWEDDWVNKEEIIKSQINNWLNLNKDKIFARKCKIVELKKCTDFLNKNHIQGVDRSKIKIGLIYQGKIVSVITFNKSEGRKKMNEGEWNLSRFCNLKNTNVIGAASKLINYFTKKYNAKRLVTYADKDWSVGNLYEILGFKKLYDTKPDYKYIINNKRVHKSRFRTSNIKENISESEFMKNIPKVWDCGKIKYEFIIK